MSGLLKYLIAAAALGTGMYLNEGIRNRGFNLGVCGVHKVNVMGLGMDNAESLAAINEKTEQLSKWLGRDIDMEIKQKVLTPLNVNELTESNEYGVWSDPCEFSIYGCGEGRPALLFLPGFSASAEAITGAVPLIARAVNSSLLVCSYTRDTAVDRAQACYEEALRNSSTVYVAAMSEGVGVAVALHRTLKEKPAGYWFMSPWMRQTECGKWLAPACGEVLPLTMTKEEKDSLPPTLVTYSTATASDAVRDWATSVGTTDTYADLPHDFVLLSDWLPQNIEAVMTAKKFFSEAK